MSIVATINSQATVQETIGTNTPFATTSEPIVHDGMNDRLTLNASSTPPAAKVFPERVALVAGAKTLDLTNLVGSAGQAIDGTGMKVRIAKFRNPATNANAITITVGASNGYLLLGTGWKITLQPGQWAGPFYLADGAPAIDSTHKTMDLSGTGTQALDVMLVIG